MLQNSPETRTSQSPWEEGRMSVLARTLCGCRTRSVGIGEPFYCGLVSAALPDIGALQNIDLILLGNRSGQNLFDVMAA